MDTSEGYSKGNAEIDSMTIEELRKELASYRELENQFKLLTQQITWEREVRRKREQTLEKQRLETALRYEREIKALKTQVAELTRQLETATPTQIDTNFRAALRLIGEFSIQLQQSGSIVNRNN